MTLYGFVLPNEQYTILPFFDPDYAASRLLLKDLGKCVRLWSSRSETYLNISDIVDFVNNLGLTPILVSSSSESGIYPVSVVERCKNKNYIIQIGNEPNYNKTDFPTPLSYADRLRSIMEKLTAIDPTVKISSAGIGVSYISESNNDLQDALSYARAAATVPNIKYIAIQHYASYPTPDYPDYANKTQILERTPNIKYIIDEFLKATNKKIIVSETSFGNWSTPPEYATDKAFLDEYFKLMVQNTSKADYVTYFLAQMGKGFEASGDNTIALLNIDGTKKFAYDSYKKAIGTQPQTANIAYIVIPIALASIIGELNKK